MKNPFYWFLIIGTVILLPPFFWGCSVGENEFTITNNSEIDRTDESVVLTRDAIIEKIGGIAIMEGKIPLPFEAEKPIPAQLDDLDGDGKWDELAFVLDIPATETKTISIEFVDKAEYPEFTQRTNIRFGVKDETGIHPVKELTLTAEELPVPLFTRFQMDGPAWENDKVGFRQYIDGRNGRDLYGKTSPEMALDTVGISDDGELVDNYHVMLPWGRDILAVGNSLGLGGLAILENDEPVRLGVRMDAPRNNVETTTYQLITEGPVRSMFKLTYEGWNTGTQTFDLENYVIIWAGKYGHTNEISLTSPNQTDTLVAGVVNIHNDQSPVILTDTNSPFTAFYTHDQQTYDKGWYLGMGIIFPKEKYLDYKTAPDSGTGITNSFLNLLDIGEDKTLEYHVFAGWELSDSRFADADYFDEFMKKELLKTSKPVVVQ